MAVNNLDGLRQLVTGAVQGMGQRVTGGLGGATGPGGTLSGPVPITGDMQMKSLGRAGAGGSELGVGWSATDPMSRYRYQMDQRPGHEGESMLGKGAAYNMANWFANGFKSPGNPNFTYSWEDAERDRAWGMQSLAEGSAAGTLSAMDQRIYDNILAGRPTSYGGYQEESGYDQNGNYVGLFGEGGGFNQGGYDAEDARLMSYGYDPLPRTSWGIGEDGDWTAAAKQMRDWERKNFGRTSDPFDDAGNRYPDTTEEEYQWYLALCQAQGTTPVSQGEFAAGAR